MKRFLLMALLATPLAAQAQVTNPSFENPGSPTVIDGSGSVNGWFHSAGNPLVSNEVLGFKSEHAAKLASSDQASNGIVGSTNFTPGNVYNVSFYVRTPECQPGRLIVSAAQGMRPGSTSVSLSETITTFSTATGGSWQLVQVTFAPNACYNQIHFFLDGRECPAIMYIDEVNVECVPGANIVPNHDFEINSGSDFASGHVTNWDASHFTPTLFSSAGNSWAWMWSYDGNGEGIVANASFQAGTTYDVSYRVRTNTPPNAANFFVVATSGLTPSSSAALPTPSGPTQTIDSDAMGTAYNNWVTVNTTFTATANHTQLWIYPLMAGQPTGGVQAELEIDDIVIRRACLRPCSIELPWEPEPVKFEGRSVTPANVEALGLTNERMAPIQVYPNPARDVVNLEVLAPAEYVRTVRILTLQGAEVAQMQMQPGHSTMEWPLPATLQGGMYLMSIDGQPGTTPLMIQR